ncbi:hypothetical protein QJS04_geneDACA011192 [Acorus gramineus]|uniref:RNase H type-1 domain-containing protein n=1 Tax=Acorus gramineus TaxID=55184 RepID=A0AAV9ANI5_ACOGR|nr:hypothetical protein QJS04_geneDACA011192 [Acorus gramineus]
MGNAESSSSSNPPGNDDDDPSHRARNESFSTALKVGGAIAGAGLLAWGASRAMSGSSHDEYETDQENKNERMMRMMNIGSRDAEDFDQVTWKPPNGPNPPEYDDDPFKFISHQDTWKPPNPGWCKVNSAASLIPGRRAGLGFLIRDQHSKFVAGAAFRVEILDDISILELKAADEGLNRAVELGFQRVLLESDSQTVVAWIRRKEKPSWTAIPILIHIAVNVSKLDDFSISHIHREGNEPANLLARHNQIMGVMEIHPNNIPRMLQEPIGSDKRSIPRMGNSESSSYSNPFHRGTSRAMSDPSHDDETDEENKINVMLEGGDLDQAPREVTWRSPNPGWCKVNSDASLIRESGRAGLGFLIRDQHSNFLAGAAFGIELDKISILELMAAAKGLNRAVELGFQRVWLELDSQTVVVWIRGKGKPSLTAIPILSQIAANVSKLEDFSISHIHREGNKPANLLASLNPDMGVMEIKPNNMPPKLQKAIDSDKEGIPQPQRTRRWN